MTQLGIILLMTPSALDPTVCVTDKDTKQRWCRYRPLRLTKPKRKQIEARHGEVKLLGQCPMEAGDVT